MNWLPIAAITWLPIMQLSLDYSLQLLLVYPLGSYLVRVIYCKLRCHISRTGCELWSYMRLGIKPRSLLLPQIMMLLLSCRYCSHQLATYCSYHLAANIAAITWLLMAAIACLPTWLILGQGDLLQTMGSYLWHVVWTLILYPPGNQTQIVTAAPNNDVVTDLQLSIG